MPKLLSKDLDERIGFEIGRHADGIGIDALHSALAALVSRRTLQRRLARWVDEGRVSTQGRGPTLRYVAIGAQGLVVREPEAERVPGAVTTPVHLSAESEEIRRLIRRPRQQRMPVSYEQSFLERYTPNQTAYLPESLRMQLHSLGRPPTDELEAAPAGTFARDILNRLLIDLSWASSQLEGNTYSRLDTERLIEYGQAASGKDALETQMILNHKAAIEYLVHDTESVGVDSDTLIALHALLSDGLMADPATCGRLRHRPVEIGGSVYLPIALPQRIEELFAVVVEMAAEIADPFEQAFFLMVHVPYLQPFEDVNKRVSRLAANIPFIHRNLSPLSFIDVAVTDYVEGLLGVYELNRVELLRDVFVRAYERSCQQYGAVRRQLVPPDAVRLRYRKQLTEIIAGIVRNGLPADAATIGARVPDAIAAADRSRFEAVVLDEFRNLHPGNVIRFGLRPLEYAAWRERIAAG